MRRPRWVWVISLYYSGMFVLSYLLLYLVASQSVAVPSAITARTENLAPLDWAVLVIQSFVALWGAIALFFLRKQAYYVFTTGFVIGLGWTVRHSLTVMTAVGMLILAAVCLYTRRLRRQGLLT